MEFLGTTDEQFASGFQVGQTGVILRSVSGSIDGYIGARFMKMDSGDLLLLDTQPGKTIIADYLCRPEEYTFQLRYDDA